MKYLYKYIDFNQTFNCFSHYRTSTQVLRTPVGRHQLIPTKSQKCNKDVSLNAIKHNLIIGSIKISFCDLIILSLISFTKEIQNICTKSRNKQTLSQPIVSSIVSTVSRFL